jgi:hypothetical protein
MPIRKKALSKEKSVEKKRWNNVTLTNIIHAKKNKKKTI